MSESIVKRYYDNLAAGHLLGVRCACGAVTFPPTTACEKCGSPELEEFELSGRGTLMFASHGIAPPPNPRFEELAPYTYGHVILEEGVPIQGMITNVKPEPEALRALYARGPVQVRLDPVKAQDLTVIGFKVL